MTRLVNRCSSRFQSNHHRGYLRRNKIISSGAKNGRPPESAGTYVTPEAWVRAVKTT